MTLWKDTLALRAFGLVKIPLLFFISPSIVKLSEKECEVKIPLNWFTKNHLNSMYFGVLAMGADCGGGLLGMDAIRRSKKKISLVFKDFKADFLKRAEGDVHFICKDGKAVKKMVERTVRTKERINRTLHIIATTPKVSGDDPVAKFELTLSLKCQK